MPESRWWPAGGATAPADKVLVWTRVDNVYGIQNEMKLCRQGSAWIDENGGFVAWTPTHWRPVEKWE